MAFNILSKEIIKLFDDSKMAVITQSTGNKKEKSIFVRHNNSMQYSATKKQTSGV